MTYNNSQTLSVAGSSNQRQFELADRIAQFAPTDGVHSCAIAALGLIRASAPTQRLPALYEPSLCIVAQGRKHAVLGAETYIYDPLHYLVISLTLPMAGQIIEATPECPYLCLRLSIDPREVADLILDGAASVAAPSAAARVASDRGLFAARMNEPLLDAVLRLLRLLDTPRDVPVLAPLALREILYRVLVGEVGDRLRELTMTDSRAQRIGRAVDLLKRSYPQPLRVEDLAEAVHMSPSSLHHHFKAVTAMSPLQFQKQLRLHEARRLMLIEGLEANTAAHRVGYESPSQFSREYKRLFGAPPKQQIGSMRTAAVG